MSELVDVRPQLLKKQCKQYVPTFGCSQKESEEGRYRLGYFILYHLNQFEIDTSHVSIQYNKKKQLKHQHYSQMVAIFQSSMETCRPMGFLMSN